jgi:hypothetical protein
LFVHSPRSHFETYMMLIFRQRLDFGVIPDPLTPDKCTRGLQNQPRALKMVPGPGVIPTRFQCFCFFWGFKPKQLFRDRPRHENTPKSVLENRKTIQKRILTIAKSLQNVTSMTSYNFWFRVTANSQSEQSSRTSLFRKPASQVRSTICLASGHLFSSIYIYIYIYIYIPEATGGRSWRFPSRAKRDLGGGLEEEAGQCPPGWLGPGGALGHQGRVFADISSTRGL